MSGTAMLGRLLTTGVKYRIRWKTPQMKYQRESVLLFLGMSDDARHYVFMAREGPALEVDECSVRFITEVQRVPRDAECYQNVVLVDNGGNE